jgi:hypothetical protein
MTKRVARHEAPKPKPAAHGKDVSFSELYVQLSRRLDDIAVKLEKRRQRGLLSTKPLIEELHVIAATLKIIDAYVKCVYTVPKTRPPELP